MKWIALHYWTQLQATDKKLESSETKELFCIEIKLFCVSKKMTKIALWIKLENGYKHHEKYNEFTTQL